MRLKDYGLLIALGPKSWKYKEKVIQQPSNLENGVVYYIYRNGIMLANLMLIDKWFEIHFTNCVSPTNRTSIDISVFNGTCHEAIILASNSFENQGDFFIITIRQYLEEAMKKGL